jgi:hypothetical protein
MTNEQLFHYIQGQFREIDSRLAVIDKKVDDNHHNVLNFLDSVSGDLSELKDELAVVDYKVNRIEGWASAFKF